MFFYCYFYTTASFFYALTWARGILKSKAIYCIVLIFLGGVRGREVFNVAGSLDRYETVTTQQSCPNVGLIMGQHGQH